MAVYLVKNGNNERLVEAKTVKSAINYVAEDIITAEKVKTPELVKMINAGHKIETLEASDEKEAA